MKKPVTIERFIRARGRRGEKGITPICTPHAQPTFHSDTVSVIVSSLSYQLSVSAELFVPGGAFCSRRSFLFQATQDTH